MAGDGDDRGRLEQRALELARDPAAVRFLGFVPEEDLPDLYRLADLFVMPSTHEGFGIVYLEAAACGLRVVGGVGGGSARRHPGRPGRRASSIRPTARRWSAAIGRSLAQGRADPAAIEPYRRPHFAAAACRLLARLLDQGRVV